ncbi:hypothetical protein A2642_02140 [Candidatus Nomurabacteria bacterium RIFCSPHIGHO2_01_FULL_39_10]|uniref:Uncharacterized protein n=1 Tax=Candidatus Nomurabacteria bacterium RIFCSPHIGHO2_01_FULL_39_10 TaxID=1801733 RepID=A0A1F6V5F6_9BACT|nr:MAG: hypothetical protein A2642_02140 [Candidatus Nomurabacteria bacterium RIFCSPHIGHO2_01_FULL_39_10]
MSTRNFILLIIVLALIAIAVFVFLYLRKEPTPPADGGTGTNFTIPFGGGGGTTKPPVTTPPVDVPGDETPPVAEIPAGKLVKVSSMPIAGFTVFSKERMKEVTTAPAVEQGLPLLKTKQKSPLTEFMPALRYVAKATGNIYQTFADKIMERKFSGTIIPKVHEAYFGNRGESVVMRYLKIDERTIETFAGALPKELLGAEITGNNEVKGYFLPNNVKDISVSPDGKNMFYLFIAGSDSEDNMIGTILNLLNNKKVQIFDSPFTEWLSGWESGNTITLSTKPSSGVSGYMYTIDSTGKNLSRILGNINGLTVSGSPNGKLTLYGDNNLSLNVYHTDTRNSDVLGIKTLPEKCVWGKASDIIYCAVPKLIGFGQYPDSWYQGEVSFNDQLWKVDIKTGNSVLLLDPAVIVGGEEIDGIKLVLDEGESYLLFVNKKDSFLWKLDLK